MNTVMPRAAAVFSFPCKLFANVPAIVWSPIEPVSSLNDGTQLAVKTEGGLSPANGNVARSKNVSHPSSSRR